jgi:hypothetical protein
VTLYASSPVWMALKLEVRRSRAGGAPTTDPSSLAELPTSRPSDTWFGPSTPARASSATRCAPPPALEVADLPLRPHRAVTPVTVENQAATPLDVARISVPMPFLALHVDRAGRLWTDGVRFTREPDEDTTVKAGALRPDGGERLAEPRSEPTSARPSAAPLSRSSRGSPMTNDPGLETFAFLAALADPPVVGDRARRHLPVVGVVLSRVVRFGSSAR